MGGKSRWEGGCGLSVGAARGFVYRVVLLIPKYGFYETSWVARNAATCLMYIPAKVLNMISKK